MSKYGSAFDGFLAHMRNKDEHKARMLAFPLLAECYQRFSGKTFEKTASLAYELKFSLLCAAWASLQEALADSPSADSAERLRCDVCFEGVKFAFDIDWVLGLSKAPTAPQHPYGIDVICTWESEETQASSLVV